jgi:hypothetical protein
LYQRAASFATRPFNFVVERLIPLQLAEEIGCAPLLAARDELLSGLGYLGLLRAFTADLNGSVEKGWIDCKIIEPALMNLNQAA